MLCAGAFVRLATRDYTPSDSLLEVSGATPKLLERGDALVVSGSGFPAGRPAEARLRGVLHRAAERPVQVRVTLTGIATRADRVEVALDDASLARIGGTGSFDGTLELSFSALHGGARVTGSASVALDFVGARRELRAPAEQLLARVGIELADVDTLGGLRLARVAPDSLAARAGLLSGDTIVSAADVRVHALSDIAPAANLSALALRVARSRSVEPLAISLQLTSADESVAFAPRLLRLGALVSFFLLVLLFASPLPSPTPLLLRALRGLEARKQRGESVLAVPRDARLLLALGPLAIGALALASQWPIDVLALSALLLFGSAGFAAAVARGAILSAPDPGQLPAVGVAPASAWASRLERVLPPRVRAFVGHAACLALLLASACLSSGTRELPGLVAQQGVAPFSWKMFTHPELALGFALYLWHAARVLPPSAAGEARGLAVARVLVMGTWSLLGVCVFAGGYRVQTDAAELARGLDAFWLGGAWLLVKALALTWLIGLLACVPAARVARGRLHAAGLLAVATASLVSTVLAPSHSTELAIGAVLGSTLLFALVIAWLEARSSLSSPAVLAPQSGR